MLSTIVIAISLGIMLLIVARLILSALRQHRLMRKHITQTHLPAHPLDRHVTMVFICRMGSSSMLRDRYPLPRLPCHLPGIHVIAPSSPSVSSSCCCLHSSSRVVLPER